MSYICGLSICELGIGVLLGSIKERMKVPVPQGKGE